MADSPEMEMTGELKPSTAESTTKLRATDESLCSRYRHIKQHRWKHHLFTSGPGNGEAEEASSTKALPKQGEKVQCNLECLYKGPENAYPEFDSLRQYNVDEAQAKTLRQLEAVRLYDIITDPKKPVLMEKSVFFDIGTDDAAYQRLSEISKSIMMALSLCLLDNECINNHSCKSVANRDRLQKLVKQAQVSSEATWEFASEEEEKDWLKAIFVLVNYISAILARLISQTATGAFWLENVLAVLVAQVAKMKFLLCNIAGCAAEAAAAGADVLKNTKDVKGFSFSIGDEEEECEEAMRILDASLKDGLTSDKDAEVASFCINQNKYRSGLNPAFKYILQSLRFMNLSGLPSTTYEMCLVAYEIGFEGFETVLYQDRDLEYSASSDPDVLNITQSALVILDQVLRQFPELEKEEKVTFEWTYYEIEDYQKAVDRSQFRSKSVSLHTMADIVTAMVPLIVASPILLSTFKNFRTMMSLTGNARDVIEVFQGTKFRAFCRLYTEDFDKEANRQEVLRLSQAFKSEKFSLCQLILDGKNPGKHRSRTSGGSTTDDNADVDQVLAEETLQKFCQDMRRWVFDQKSVTVPAWRYVSTVMFFALILCGGGLGLGFTVGERISGVDPFDLASYNWVLAAFLILICKAVRVENWAWSDFLRWRVRCRSVSELASMTGIDEQVIIAKLLHEDCGDGILQTSGPYNSVFRRQKTEEGQGFSIDEPIHPATFMLSGLTLLKVVTPREHAIVCLDHRRGTSLATVLHQGSQDKHHLVCDDVNRRIKDNSSGKGQQKDWREDLREDLLGLKSIKLHLTKAEDFKWKRVQGLYDFKNEDVVFT